MTRMWLWINGVACGVTFGAAVVSGKWWLWAMLGFLILFAASCNWDRESRK